MSHLVVYPGGSWQNSTGWALSIDNDVIILMTSLLLFYPAKKLGEQLPTLPTRPLPPCYGGVSIPDIVPDFALH